MKIGVGSNRSGFEFKESLKARLTAQTHSVEDVRTSDLDPSGYRNVADHLASAIYCGRMTRGVLICSSAIGASVAANKHPLVRAAFCHEVSSARCGVHDDNMNLLVLEAQIVTHELVCQLADAFVSASYAPRNDAIGIPARRLARVAERIRNNLDKPLEVSELSELAEMSRSDFSKLFKRSTDLTPHRFILHERINRSKELLRQGNTKIADIALEVGFQNQAHFTTVFGSLVGMTPRQFRCSSCDRLVDKVTATDAGPIPDFRIGERLSESSR